MLYPSLQHVKQHFIGTPVSVSFPAGGHQEPEFLNFTFSYLRWRVGGRTLAYSFPPQMPSKAGARLGGGGREAGTSQVPTARIMATGSITSSFQGQAKAEPELRFELML